MNVYFHIESVGFYYYDLIVLAQGFRDNLNKIYCNKDYYQGLNNEFLLKDNISHVDSKIIDVVVFSSVDLVCSSYLDRVLSRFRKDVCSVLIDIEDGLYLKSDEKWVINSFDLILKNTRSNYKYTDRIRPWFYGLSNEIIELSKLVYTNYDFRKNSVGINYRWKHPVRIFADDKLSPVLEASKKYFVDRSTDGFDGDNFKMTNENYLTCTSNRHSFEYLSHLASMKLSFAFCGYFRIPIIQDFRILCKFAPFFGPNIGESRLRSKYECIFGKINHTNRVYQWDSWRFWESLAVGTVPLHVDLQLYGLDFKGMPISGKHYFGFDFNKPLSAQMDNMTEGNVKLISNLGRNWVYTNCNPKFRVNNLLNEFFL